MASTDHTPAAQPVSAAHIVDLVIAKFADRVEVEESFADQWSSADSHARYVALIRRGLAWPGNGANKVVASVSGPDDKIWGHVAAEVLDSAVDGLPLDGAVIEKVSNGVYSLTWEPVTGHLVTEDGDVWLTSHETDPKVRGAWIMRSKFAYRSRTGKTLTWRLVA